MKSEFLNLSLLIYLNKSMQLLLYEWKTNILLCFINKTNDYKLLRFQTVV